MRPRRRICIRIIFLIDLFVVMGLLTLIFESERLRCTCLRT
jgi:hypothetical protein